MLWLGGKERTTFASLVAAVLLQRQVDLDPAGRHGITRDGQIFKSSSAARI